MVNSLTIFYGKKKTEEFNNSKNTLVRWPGKKNRQKNYNPRHCLAPTSRQLRVLKVLHQSLTGLNDKCTGNLLEKHRKLFCGN